MTDDKPRKSTNNVVSFLDAVLHIKPKGMQTSAQTLEDEGRWPIEGPADMFLSGDFPSPFVDFDEMVLRPANLEPGCGQNFIPYPDDDTETVYQFFDELGACIQCASPYTFSFTNDFLQWLEESPDVYDTTLDMLCQNYFALYQCDPITASYLLGTMYSLSETKEKCRDLIKLPIDLLYSEASRSALEGECLTSEILWSIGEKGDKTTIFKEFAVVAFPAQPDIRTLVIPAPDTLPANPVIIENERIFSMESYKDHHTKTTGVPRALSLARIKGIEDVLEKCRAAPSAVERAYPGSDIRIDHFFT